MSDQTYNVKYNIEVESTTAVQELSKFTSAVETLSKFQTDMTGAVERVKTAMNEIDKVFSAKGKGKKDDFNFKFNIDTKSAEEKIGRLLTSVNKIAEQARGIKLVINPGKAFNSKGVEANAKQIIQQSQGVFRNIASTTHTTQTSLTRSIGKINSALVHLQKGREINIKTDQAKGRLTEILGLLRQVRSESSRAMNLGGVAGRAPVKGARTVAQRAFLLPPYAQTQLRNTGLFGPTPVAPTPKVPDPNKAAAAQQKIMQRQNADIVRNLVRTQQQSYSSANSRQKAAINRLQYSRPPQLRNALPFAYMLNGYMLFSQMKSQLTAAVEYANIMESAHSILRVADKDLGTFERRFDTMARNVRQVGIETKFTAVQVAGAVKYLAMAGQDINTINKSIRPITNLALIGDNDIAQIADLTTNIMAGYDIDPRSMPAVADIIASTISRSNVNIIETAESFKMAAGYLRMAGIDFTESSAAIGILGNVGIKGTMAGTSMRSIATRLASQPKEAQEILNTLGVKFTHFVDVYGEKLEKIRPLADIFEDLKEKGATLGDMTKIFGRWGANAGMALMLNTDKLRENTAHNRTSYGVSGTLAQVKQETTKGLWFQMTSMLSESFMKGYEILEPKIQSVLRKFTENFNTDQFAEGLSRLANVLLDIFGVLGKIATWFINNFNWIEPILFTGFAATKIFKMAGAVTNLAVALGILGKKSAALSGVQILGSLTGGLGGVGGLGGKGLSGALTFGARRQLVTNLRQAGITGGKGAMTAALKGAGLGRNAGLLSRVGASGMFATQVATGKGLVGAGSAIASIGTGAVAAVGGVAALVGVLGYAAYRTWKIKEAKDAVFADLAKKEVHSYPDIDALYNRLDDVYKKALDANAAVNNVTRDGRLRDTTGQAPTWFTGRWWKGMGQTITWALNARYGADISKFYTTGDAYQDDLKESIETLARYDGVQTFAAAYGELGNLKSKVEVDALLHNIPVMYGYRYDGVDESLYDQFHRNADYRYFRKGLKNMTVDEATQTWEYRQYHNEQILPKIANVVREYADLMGSPDKALGHVLGGGLTADILNRLGLQQGEDGRWHMTPLAKNATEEQKGDYLKNQRELHYLLGARVEALRTVWGNDGRIAENIMEKAGFSPELFGNEPERNDMSPWNANGISVTPTDDEGAGGNYSGSGKLSSAAPKQVIVTIGNLLSIETIQLLKSSEGNQPEIQDLKQQMAQALIDVVHDFDASWNGA